MLRNAGPIHWTGRTWLVVDHKAVEQGLTESNLSARRVAMLFTGDTSSIDASPLAQVLKRWTFFNDPPNVDMSNLKADRKLIWDHLGPANLSSFPEFLKAEAEMLCDRWTSGRVDLIGDFAYKIRLLTLSRLFEVSDGDAHSILSCADPIFEFITASQPEAEMVRMAELSMSELLAILGSTPTVRRMFAGADQQSRRVSIESQMALLAVVSVFIEKAIGNVLSVLLSDTANWELVHEPEHDLSSIIREALRLESPTQITSRVALRDFVFSGQNILKDQLVSLVIGSANRDPSVFSQPEKFRLDRTSIRTLTFGIGGKRCPGEWLSETIISTAIKALAKNSKLSINHARMNSGSLTKVWRENMESRRLLELSIEL